MEIQTQELPDEQLAEAAQNGHLKSFGALYQRYYSSMVALAYSLLADRDLAEDAAQESFMVACRDLPKLKSKYKFAAWLAGICRNIAKQMLRIKGKKVLLSVEQPSESRDEQEHCWDALHQAVWKLREAERELIVLHYFNGFSRTQISQVLDISPQALNGRLIRAKRKIAQYLKQNGFTGDDYETP